MSTEPDRAMTNAELIGQLRDVLDELCERAENYARATQVTWEVGCEEAWSEEATEDGLVLTMKADRLVSDAWRHLAHVKSKLVKVAAYGVPEEVEDAG